MRIADNKIIKEGTFFIQVLGHDKNEFIKIYKHIPLMLLSFCYHCWVKFNHITRDCFSFYNEAPYIFYLITYMHVNNIIPYFFSSINNSAI